MSQADQSWLERLRDDPSLRAFLEAEIARAGIALDTAQHNCAHWKAVADKLQAKVDGLIRDRAAGKQRVRG